MLDYAQNHRTALKISLIWSRDLNDYDNDMKKSLMEKKKTSPEEREFVSLSDDGAVIGYFSYYIKNNSAYNFTMLCLSEKYREIFSSDLYRCIKDIFSIFNLSEVRWSIKKGHPVWEKEKLLVQRLGGLIDENMFEDYLFVSLKKENIKNFV